MFSRLREYRVIPTAADLDETTAIDLADALHSAGLPVLMLQYKNHNDAIVIRKILEKYPDFIIGVNGILNADLVMRAYDANAKFMLSPGVCEGVIKEAKERNLELASGVCTPTEIMRTLYLGMTDIHFFPAQFIGGAPMLEDILKPFEHLKLNVIVNGGITEDCLKEYLALESVAAIVTPWIVTENDIEYKQWGDVHDKALKLKEMINNKRVIYFNK